MTSGPSLVVSVPDAQLAVDLHPLPEGVELVVWNMKDAAPRPQLDILVVPYLNPPRMLRVLDDLTVGLLQVQWIGYENVAKHLPEGLTVANAASVHEASTAELAMTITLAALRRIPDFVRAKDEHRWAQGFSDSLADRRVVLLGFGGVGKAIASRLAGFEVELSAIATRARFEDGVTVHAIDDLHMALADADVLISSLPGGDETRHVIDDAALSALPDGALVVNVGRGALIDTNALVDHVSRGRIRAALDVTDPEPLPAGHPLWSLPGVLISPHVGGLSTAMTPRIARLIRRQIDRMLAGEPPLNLVIGG